MLSRKGNICTLVHLRVCTVEPLNNGHHWDHYGVVSFAQEVIVDHTPHTIMASYAGARLWAVKS